MVRKDLIIDYSVACAALETGFAIGAVRSDDAEPIFGEELLLGKHFRLFCVRLELRCIPEYSIRPIRPFLLDPKSLISFICLAREGRPAS